MPWEGRPRVCWPQEGTKGDKKKEVIKTKVKVLVDMSHEDHVNYV
jgi:hypothetical protein